MLSNSKTQVAVLLADPQSQRLARLFALPDFANDFSITFINLNDVRSKPLMRLYRRGRNYLGIDRKMGSSIEDRLRTLLDRQLRGVDVILGLDNQLSTLDSLVRLSAGNLRAVAIQMGTNPKYYQRTTEHVRHSPVTFLSWGRRELEQYAREGLVPNRIIPTGSLMRALADHYSVDRQSNRYLFDVCIVSQFRPLPLLHEVVSESAHAEGQSMPALLRVLSPILRRRELKTVVALRAEKFLSSAIKSDEERDCFQKYLECPFSFTNQADLFSSYAAVDSSRITIGRNSGLLFESVGSNSRILFVNPTEWSLFDPPATWPFGKTMPTAEQLERDIERLLEMPRNEYYDQTQRVVDSFCTTKIDTLSLIKEVLVG